MKAFLRRVASRVKDHCSLLGAIIPTPGDVLERVTRHQTGLLAVPGRALATLLMIVFRA